MPSVSQLFLAEYVNLAICLSFSLDIFAQKQYLGARYRIPIFLELILRHRLASQGFICSTQCLMVYNTSDFFNSLSISS